MSVGYAQKVIQVGCLRDMCSITKSMRCVMLKDRLIGVGIREARIEILGGLMGSNDTVRNVHLGKTYQQGMEFQYYGGCIDHS